MAGQQRTTRPDQSFLAEHVEPAVRRVTESIQTDARLSRFNRVQLPDPADVVDVLGQLQWLLLPGDAAVSTGDRSALSEQVRQRLATVGSSLLSLVAIALRADPDVPDGDEADRHARRAVGSLLSSLPEIRAAISLDVQAALDGDPAARSIEEVALCYPGVRALCVHRVAHELDKHQVPLVPRMMSEHAHSVTGIDIHPGARIGKCFLIDHGTGVVIGETAIIGDHCTIYQGVTLGAARFDRDAQGRLLRGNKRHPTLEDHVTVYAGATILGGSTVIGAGSTVNGGVFITSSVPPGHVVRGPKLDITLRTNPDVPPSNFNI